MEMNEVGGCRRLASFRSCRPNPRTPKIKRRGASKSDKTSSPCASPKSSPSSIILDRVILARSPAVRFGDEAGCTEYAQNDFVQECLQWHNTFRVKHKVPHLILSEQLCHLAQFWCNHLAHNNTFYHRNSKDIGENLFCRCSPAGDIDVTGQQIARYWYDEVKTYNFKQEPSTLHVNAGHFSQMVWKSCIEFGIGKARTRCGKVMVVANYRPGGNIIGEFQNNVLPPDDLEDEIDILDELEGMVF